MLRRRRSPYLHRHLDTRTEPIDDGHQTINRETTQVSVTDAGKVRRSNPRAGLSFPYGEPVAIECLDDLVARIALNCRRSGLSFPTSRYTLPLPRTTSNGSAFIATSPSIA